MITFALLVSAATGVIAYSIASHELESQAENQLRALLEARADSVERYFTTVEEDVILHAQSDVVTNAITAFDDAWDDLDQDPSNYLRSNYIDGNPLDRFQREELLDAGDGSEYSAIHSEYHPQLRNVLHSRGYYDVFLFNTEGDLVYSVVKESDFATNMVSGEWSDTHLATVFRQIDQDFASDRTAFTDFARYAPSDGDPASFLGAPVFDENRQYIGAFAVQMPIDKLNEVMQVTAGMGETGETYLVGEDLLMRSDSRFLATSSILITEADTEAVSRALLGQTGVDVIEDYRGVPVYSAYSAVEFGGTRWAILAEIDESEVRQPIDLLLRLLLVAGVILALLITVIGSWLAGTLSKPLVSMTSAMNRLAQDDISTNVSVSDRTDEIGDMARAMVVFRENAIAKIELQRELKHLSEHDELTALPGRTAMMNRTQDALKLADSVGRQSALLYIDVDDFKVVNDTHGHSAGDDLLRLVAAVLRDTILPAHVAGRIGGDEFVVLMPHISHPDRAREMAENIMAALRAKTGRDLRFAETGVSIGAAVFPDDAETGQALFDSADSAMYEAKRHGKGQVIVRSGVTDRRSSQQSQLALDSSRREAA